ncbi:hypothetical protein HY995_05080 [Candidatus Micrarchaeota archaeon]|nr:hypothetical protein [Candidatus Micrarchaeota archaeon]
MADAVSTGAFYLAFMAGAFSIGYPLVRLGVKRSREWDAASKMGYGAVVGIVAVLAAFGIDLVVSGRQAALSSSGEFAALLLAFCTIAALALRAFDSVWPKTRTPARPAAPVAPEPEVKVVRAGGAVRPATVPQTIRKPQEELAFASSNQREWQSPLKSPSTLEATGIPNVPRGKSMNGIAPPDIRNVSPASKKPAKELPVAGPVRRKTFEEIMDEMGIK